MGKTKEIDLSGDEDNEDTKADLTEEEIEFEAVIAELGPQKVRWHISCKAPAEKAGYVATWESGEEISLARIAREFGAGEYAIRPVGAKGRIVPGGRNVKISSNAAYEREKAKQAPAPVAAPAAANQTIGMAEIIAILQSSQSNTMSMMQAMMQSQQQASQAMMQSQTSLLTAIVSRPMPEPREGLGAPELVSMMESMRNMVAPAESANGVDALMKGIELAKELGVGGGGETDFLGIAAKGLDIVGSALKNNTSPKYSKSDPGRASQTVQVRQVPDPPRPAPQPAAQSPAPKSEEPMSPNQQKLKWLKAQLARLLQLAIADKNPQLYAAVLLDNLPDFLTEGELREHFGDASAITKLQFVEPKVAEHKDWFEEFRQAVIEQLDDDAADDAGEAVMNDATEVAESE